MHEQAFEPRQRLHPMSWLFATVAFVRQFIVPIIVAVLFGTRNDGPPWLGYIALPLIAAAIWKQCFYRYGLGPTGLVIREGLFFNNVRQIDYARIENIDTERRLLHRLLGVAEVRVETSTGGRPEALIQVLGLRAAEELRRQVFASRGHEARPSATAEEEVLLHMPSSELVKFGLIDNRGMLVVAGLFGLIHQSGAFDVLSALIKSQLSDAVLNEVVASGPVIQGALALGVLAFGLILVRAFSVVFALVTLHDFKLVRVGADLRARYGLFTRIALTLRLRRIQTAHVVDTVLHRLFRRVTMRVDLAGDGASSEHGAETHSKVRWLAPLAEPRFARELIAKALPSVDFTAAVDWQPLAPRARRRIFRRSLVIWVLLTIVLAATLRSYWSLLLLLVGVAMSAWYATKYVRYTRWALQPDALFFRHGWLTRKLVIVPRHRVQVVCLKESPFDRRHRMASVSVDTAGAGVSSDAIRVPYLDLEVARSLAAALGETAALTEPEQDDEQPAAIGAVAT